ncbi:hypothetical protein BDQ17DRAFT_1420778 [Cyathus striatus]|nr:hypothetical protein BDQ17DRAFT_1420778 [Cyathus striatus]
MDDITSAMAPTSSLLIFNIQLLPPPALLAEGSARDFSFIPQFTRSIIGKCDLHRVDLTRVSPSPSAWQSQDIAPYSNSGISIPVQEHSTGVPMSTDDPSWTTNSASSGRSPRDAPKRNRRSKSPGRDDHEGDCKVLMWWGLLGEMEKRVAGTNTGNNLHVSELTYKTDTRELEATFAKIGRVSVHFLAFRAFVYAGYNVLLPASLMYFSSFAFSPFSLASLLSYPLLLPSYLFSLSLLPLLFPTFSPSSFAAPFLLPLSPSHFSHSSHTSPYPILTPYVSARPFALRLPLSSPRHPFLASFLSSCLRLLLQVRGFGRVRPPHPRISQLRVCNDGDVRGADAAITPQQY